MFDVKSSDDLLALYDEYKRLASSGFDGKLEVRLAPGDYSAVGWSLAVQGVAPPPPIDIVLLGGGTVLPSGPVGISGRSVTIQDLVWTDSRATTLKIEVLERVAIVGSALVRGRFADPGVRWPFLQLVARGSGGKKSPVEVRIEDSWFIGNQQPGPEPCSLVALATHPTEPGVFEKVVIRNDVFIGNAFAAELEIGYAKSTVIEHSLFISTWPLSGALKAVTTGPVVVTDSVLIAEDPARLTVSDHAEPIDVKHARLMARAAAPAAAIALVEQSAAMAPAMPPADLRDRLWAALASP
ncbi:MAG: hypothetical protein IT370_08885 [Deltaproteobacteria bacterium]|nr:hypothetical protein [Deltaproteobacteria bacterium]